jgi:DNA repair photolyase
MFRIYLDGEEIMGQDPQRYIHVIDNRFSRMQGPPEPCRLTFYPYLTPNDFARILQYVEDLSQNHKQLVNLSPLQIVSKFRRRLKAWARHVKAFPNCRIECNEQATAKAYIRHRMHKNFPG